ncbi:MAG: hypothetical protein K0S42_17 [Microvirga sp.]|jgi:hypothetical protein|nr:hypothetical protein [Microvirga sp.]
MTPSPLRRLALRLACMDDESRAWIFSQLTSEERRRVDALMAELDALGLLHDESVLRAVLGEPDAPIDGKDDRSCVTAVLPTVLKSPAWAGLLNQAGVVGSGSDDRGERAAWNEWRDFWARHSVPASWREVLEECAQNRDVVRD